MNPIIDKFAGLDKEKQKRIINAALEEFAERGYQEASTNRIVKAAGIGKGMLFYYFKNKKTLYHYLLTDSLDIMLNDFLEEIDMNETDFIERLHQIARIKLKLFIKHPHVINFLGTFMLAQEDNFPVDISEKYQRLQTIGFSKMYEDIDRSLFRSDIDVEKAFQLIRWGIEGYQEELKMRLKGEKFKTVDMGPYWDEFYEYLAILKTAFYQKGVSGL
ncbi:TetR/AcrR family transcriptional regulator [Paraliobacillus zengyii]|uniref:TetR/AcrR family transcriptional regulator n=1 Tax=Paraliobacillus zengyii TaxID=2213194 RepID=UPI002FCD8E8A